MLSLARLCFPGSVSFSFAFSGFLSSLTYTIFHLIKMIPPFPEGNYPIPGDLTEVL